MNEKKKKTGQTVTTVIMLLLGVAGGVAIGFYLMNSVFSPEQAGNESIGGLLLRLCIFMLMLLAAIFIQIILHEGGHLVFGLASGYRFSSFRIGSVMLLRTESGYSLKKTSLPGTAGQCLLIPPEMKDGDFPFRRYNLGGVIVNLISAVIAAVLFFVLPGSSGGHAFLLMTAVFGLILAFSNGVPMALNSVPNDGYNLRMMQKDPTARRSLWVQLMVSSQQMEGVRLKDMPQEWFTLPGNADMNNILVSTVGVFAENRAMDALRFDEAKAWIADLVSDRCTIAGVYNAMLAADWVYLDLLERGRFADLSPLERKENKPILAKMRNFPTVLRLEYAKAKLMEGDAARQQTILARFEKVSKNYPAKADIASERELIRLVDEKISEAYQ